MLQGCQHSGNHWLQRKVFPVESQINRGDKMVADYWVGLHLQEIFILSQFLEFCPFLGVSKKVKQWQVWRSGCIHIIISSFCTGLLISLFCHRFLNICRQCIYFCNCCVGTVC